MYGFGPISDVPLGATPITGNVVGVSQVLTLLQNGYVDGTRQTTSQILFFNQTINVDVSKIVVQTLSFAGNATLTKSITNIVAQSDNLAFVQNANADRIYAIKQTIGLVQSNPIVLVNYKNDTNQILAINQNANRVSNQNVVTTQTLTLSQLPQITNTFANTQTLTFANTVTFARWDNLTQNLTISQIPTINIVYKSNVAQSLNLYNINNTTTPNDIGQSVLITQSLSTGNAYSMPVSQTILFTQNNSVGVGNNTKQTINTVQILNGVVTYNIPTAQTILINQLTAISGTTSPNQTLNFVQIVNANFPTYLNVTQALTFTQNNTIVGFYGPQQTLAFNQNVNYVHSAIANLSQNLAFSSVAGFGKAMSVNQTLTLTQTAIMSAPINISQTQILILTQNQTTAQGLFVNQTLTLTQSQTIVQTNKCVQSDKLAFIQLIDNDLTTKNIKQVLALAQSSQFSYGTTNTQTLTFTQNNQIAQTLGIRNTLALTQANVFVGNYKPNIIQKLDIQPTVTPTVNYGIVGLQTLSLKNKAQINNLYYLSLCGCLNFNSRVTNFVPLAVIQKLKFVWTQKDVEYQRLQLVQTIITNMENVDCCHPLGNNNTRDSGATVQLAQNINCATTYNVSVLQTLKVLTASAWRT